MSMKGTDGNEVRATKDIVSNQMPGTEGKHERGKLLGAGGGGREQVKMNC